MIEKETIFGIILFIFCLGFLVWKIIEGRKKIDVFYKIDGFYFKNKENAQLYWEQQKARRRFDLRIYTYDLESKIRIDKAFYSDFFKE